MTARPIVLLFKSGWDRADWWRKELTGRVPGLAMRVWPEVGDPAEIELVLVWKPKPGDLARYANLKAILSLGAGVDHLFADPALPQVPICRLVDPGLTASMTEFVLTQVLRFHRDLPGYERQQQRGEWAGRPWKRASERTVGVMGLGELGGAAAAALAAHGFRVAGWSRSAKTLPGIACHQGAGGLDAFLAETEILACLLPLTQATEGILNRATFARLPRGAFLVNAARGAHLVEEDLLAALDSGQLAGAALDVFRKEPLPAEHPFWTHPRIFITPHVAAITDPRTAADAVAENIRRARDGQPLLHIVDRARGY